MRPELPLFAVLVAGCFAGCAAPQPRVQVSIDRHGSLQRLVREKNVGAVVSLLDVAPGPRAYALGALADLAGEVTVVDDVVYVARANPDMTVAWTRTRRSAVEACLLVATRVERWSETVLDASLDLAGLERELPRLARAAGLDPDEPFPFQIRGPAERVAFHVIDGTKLVDTGDVHADHLRASREYEAHGENVLILGFHSIRDAGVFTHHGATVHAHVVFESTLRSGHVDELQVGRGAVIAFPR